MIKWGCKASLKTYCGLCGDCCMYIILIWGVEKLQKSYKKKWAASKKILNKAESWQVWPKLSHTLCIYLCVFTCSMISLLFMAPCCRGDISIAMAMSIDAWNPPVWYSSNYLSVLGSLRVRMSGETDRCCQKKRKKGVQMEMRDNCRQEGKIRERN